MTSASHIEDSRGVSSGTGTIGGVRPFWISAARRIMSTYRSTSGPPTSKTWPMASGRSSTPTR